MLAGTMRVNNNLTAPYLSNSVSLTVKKEETVSDSSVSIITPESYCQILFGNLYSARELRLLGQSVATIKKRMQVYW